MTVDNLKLMEDCDIIEIEQSYLNGKLLFLKCSTLKCLIDDVEYDADVVVIRNEHGYRYLILNPSDIYKENVYKLLEIEEHYKYHVLIEVESEWIDSKIQIIEYTSNYISYINGENTSELQFITKESFTFNFLLSTITNYITNHNLSLIE